MPHLSEADRALVSAAVAEAEARSDGEIVTIVAGRSDSYHDVALHYAVLAMLLVPAALAFVPERCIDAWTRPFLGWNEALDRGIALFALMLLLALAFLAARLLFAWMPLRMALTPGGTKSRRVGRRALALFKAGAERRTAGRTGILLYLSLLEHRAEIVADEAIHSQVDPEVWGAAMAVLIDHVKAGRLADGMAAAVAEIGAVLATCLPKTPGDANQVADRLIEL